MVVTRRAARAVSATTSAAALVVASVVASVVVLSGSAVLGAGAVAVAAPAVSAEPAGRVALAASAEPAASAGRVAAIVSAAPVTSAAAIVPEADVSHHGHVVLWDAGLAVRVRTENHGPSSLAGVTVRVRTSVALAERQELSQNCLQTDRWTVLCRTGALRADGAQERLLALDLRLAGRPDEAVVWVDTLWNGGAADRNPENNDHEVLALATGDEYVF
ncbi:hypothetical protein ACFXPV_13270 [Streptomyces sp. NPDC059118]|uniref:hypothetical protein n=1 Tax=unclassified Streptomyces TaxID=2593676 RepID=UPI003684224E